MKPHCRENKKCSMDYYYKQYKRFESSVSYEMGGLCYAQTQEKINNNVLVSNIHFHIHRIYFLHKNRSSSNWSYTGTHCATSLSLYLTNTLFPSLSFLFCHVSQSLQLNEFSHILVWKKIVKRFVNTVDVFTSSLVVMRKYYMYKYMNFK